jgi:hypothetical protein
MRNGRRLLERATNIRFQSDHFELKLGAGVADLQMLRKLVRSRAGVGSDKPACILASHDDTSVPETSGAGVNP